MPRHTFRAQSARGDLPLSLMLGAVFAATLFVMMSLAQMIGQVKPKQNEIEETLVAYVPPPLEQIEEEPPPPPEEKEPPPELEAEPPQLSLDQLDIALNPGTGGSLAGDFSLPTITTSAKALGTEDFVDFSNLDQIPRPIGVTGLNFPRRLRAKKVSGTIVLLLRLDSTGEVLDVSIDQSDLPEFDEHVLGQVRHWRFTPPTQQGRPVKAKARLPIPIRIQ